MNAQNRPHYNPQTSVASKSRIVQILFVILAAMRGVRPSDIHSREIMPCDPKRSAGSEKRWIYCSASGTGKDKVSNFDQFLQIEILTLRVGRDLT
jgi:hypothetical protein